MPSALKLDPSASSMLLSADALQMMVRSTSGATLWRACGEMPVGVGRVRFCVTAAVVATVLVTVASERQ